MTDLPVIHADIGDGKRRRFFLGADELRMMKREAGRGYYSIYSTFHEGTEPHEVEAIIRLALIGGGETAAEAGEITGYYCTPPRSLERAYSLAFDCLNAAWKGSKPASSGRVMTTEEMDSFFDDLEADLIRKGHSPEIIKGKSFAEIQDLLNRLRKDGDKPDAPDADIFNAIKKSGKKGH